jgi:hypothetical protein
LWAGPLTSQGASVLDLSNVPRTTFSSNERIALTQQVNNGGFSASRVQFSFFIDAPSGSTVFSHTGNQAPGAVGNSAAKISGVNISQFFTGPGIYTMRAQATLDGQTVTQTKTFTVSSPNIILIYPPNGSVDLSDKPVTLRWSSSGAQRYRVTVGDNPSFFNSVFSQETIGNEDFLSYPENPSDERQNLSAGTVYYWKVEGLDSSGNKVAESAVPFSFSVAQSGALTRDLAVTSLQPTAVSASAYSFRVVVENLGGTSESNIQLKFSLGGLPAAGSPTQLPLMAPLSAKEYTYTVEFPADQNQSLAVACLEFFDDNVPNNCKTLNITRSQATDADGTVFGADRQLTDDELWAAISELLREQGVSLEEYGLISVDGQLTTAQLEELLAQLRSGSGSFEITGPPEGIVDSGGSSGGDVGGGGLDLGDTGDYVEPLEVWEKIAAALTRRGIEFDDYKLKEASREMDQLELDALISAIDRGRATIEVSGPPPGEVLPPPVDDGPPPVAIVGDALGNKEVWAALKSFIARLGEGFENYDLEDASPPIDDAGMAALIEALRKGQATVEVSGPPADTGTESDSGTDSGSPLAVPDEEQQAPALAEGQQEWGGFTSALTKRVAPGAVRSARNWKRTWRRLERNEAVPNIDFKKNIVIGVLAGSQDRADRVEIVVTKVDLTGFLVRYKLVVHDRLVQPLGARKARARGGVPYFYQVIPKTDLKIRFERVEE